MIIAIIQMVGVYLASITGVSIIVGVFGPNSVIRISRYHVLVFSIGVTMISSGLFLN